MCCAAWKMLWFSRQFFFYPLHYDHIAPRHTYIPRFICGKAFAKCIWLFALFPNALLLPLCFLRGLFSLLLSCSIWIDSFHGWYCVVYSFILIFPLWFGPPLFFFSSWAKCAMLMVINGRINKILPCEIKHSNIHNIERREPYANAYKNWTAQ